jgi:hypothetical protein
MGASFSDTAFWKLHATTKSAGKQARESGIVRLHQHGRQTEVSLSIQEASAAVLGLATRQCEQQLLV